MSNWFTINDESVIGNVIIADDFETAQSFLGGNPISSNVGVSPIGFGTQKHLPQNPLVQKNHTSLGYGMKK